MNGRLLLAMGSTAVCLATGCAWTQQRPADSGEAGAESLPPEVSSAAPGSTDPLDTQATRASAVTPVELSEQVAFAIQQVEGTSAAAAGALLAPAADSVGRCAPKEPGALQVKVNRDGEQTNFEVVPGSSVDADTRRCVLAAMAMLDAEDPPAPSGTPSAEPRAFSSTVSISW